MGAKVEIISRELIKPSVPTPPESKHLKPSFLDQLSPPCFIPLVFFYENQSSSRTVDSLGRFHHLKQSLSECLATFYPLAGKVNPDLSADCDDSGALFLQAKVHAPFSQAFQNAHLPKLNQFLPFHPFEMDGEKLLDEYPINEILLAVQFSCFECGSDVIGVCLSHAVGDVMCLVELMNSWASTSRGESSANSLVLEPNFDSGRRLFPALEAGLLPSSTEPNPGPDAPVVKVKNISNRLLFDKEKIEELKQLATSSSASPLVKDPTRVEVVTAFIWKHFIKLARAKNKAAKTMFIARHAVNVRSRLSSLASDAEFPFGNFTIVTSTSFMSDEGQEEKDYHDLVRLTSAGLRKIDEDFVINNVKSNPQAYLSIMNGVGIEELQEGEAMVSDCYFTSWNRFPMYEVDFGWGKPSLVTPAGTPAGSGVVVLMGTKSGDGIEAWVGLKEDEINLLSDEFLSLATTEIFPVN